MDGQNLSKKNSQSKLDFFLLGDIVMSEWAIGISVEYLGDIEKRKVQLLYRLPFFGGFTSSP